MQIGIAKSVDPDQTAPEGLPRPVCPNTSDQCSVFSPVGIVFYKLSVAVRTFLLLVSAS